MYYHKKKKTWNEGKQEASLRDTRSSPSARFLLSNALCDHFHPHPIPTPHLHLPVKITWSTSDTHLVTIAGSGLPCDWSVCMPPPLTRQSFSGCVLPSCFPCGYFFFLQFSHYLTADVLYTAEASSSFKSLFLFFCEFSHRIVKEKKKGEEDRISQQFHTSPSVVPHPEVKQLSRCTRTPTSTQTLMWQLEWRCKLKT